MPDKAIVVVTLEIEGAQRQIELDPTKLPLIFLEALDDLKDNNSGGWRKLRRGVRKMLKLTEAESEELTSDHLTMITEALGSAQSIPNG
jgi:hypothetical protein